MAKSPPIATGQLPLFEFDAENLQKMERHQPFSQRDESEYSKYIVYVDESGDHSLQSIDQQYPVFVLAFCVFHKRHYSEVIVPALEKFKFNHFGHDQVVLHENEIRRRTGKFNIFKSKAHQAEFMDELTQIIDFSNFILISTTIDKRDLKRLNTADNAYHIALGYCMETLHEFLTGKSESAKKTHVVFECRGDKEDKELELEFRRICDGNNRLGIPFPFEILAADKRVMSSGLQLADLVARPIGLSTLRPHQSNRAFDILKRKFYCDGGREAVGSGYEGVGMKIFPPPKSEKPR
ncbi:DUF3800 domain-containing protein [Saccharospirillum impatiens]|uniref:DUF3800 domain-containing protein n=1 Tax=Saccharospirillum impatiens TaxID=169438 RepID=UPI0004024DD4|nr:DUF3800 domain-containing protein [Saccharospirillum impatiens]